MDTRIIRLCLCLLVATFATGCGTLRGLLLDPVGPTIPVSPGGMAPAPRDPAPEPQPSSIPGGTIVATGGVGGQAIPPGAGASPNTLPQPRPVPVPPGWPPGTPVPPSGQQPPAQNPQAPQPLPSGVTPPSPSPNPATDPHLRANPTVTGGRLNLAPWEVPADRVVELSKQLEVLLAQNRDLLARIKELEALGVGREQALAEAMREIDSITAAGTKERNALQGQIQTLQGRIKQLEEEDIIFLRAVIEALGKLLPPEKKP